MALPSPGTSTYQPASWSTISASAVFPAAVGIQGTITAGQTQNIDTVIANDSLIRAVNLLVSNGVFGDTISVQVVDVDGVYLPAGTVVSTPVSNWSIVSDRQQQASYESVAPFKLKGGLYVRLAYSSTGQSDVKLAANFIFLTVLL